MKKTTKCILYAAAGSFISIPISGLLTNWSFTGIIPGILIGIGMLFSAFISEQTND